MSASSEQHSPASSNYPRSRTLAIITSQGIPHRFDIESRITSSGFEVVKERQIGFHAEDPSVYELFGDEAASVCGEPVRVYVLERRRAVQVWQTLMGDLDPEVARSDAPESLRALYGKTIHDNAVYGSPNEPMAELQINSIFASSPPFPPIDLPDDIPAAISTALPESASSNSSHNTGGSPTARVDIKSKSKGFKALPLPPTTAVPSIQPRMSRASALRAGLNVTPVKRVIATKESLARTFENVPGHKRSETITVASTAPPAIMPKPNRALALRIDGENKDGRGLRKPPSVAKQPISPERTKEIFENTPGHKRRDTISVASTAPPAILPRPTRASTLRIGGDSALTASTSAFSPKTSKTKEEKERSLRGRVSFDNVPGHKRNITVDVPSVRPPSTPPRINRSALLRIAHKEGGSSGVTPPSSFFMKPVSVPRPSVSRANSQSSSVRASAPPATIGRSHSQNSMRLAPPPHSNSTTSASGRSASADPTTREAEASASGSTPRTTAAAPRPPSIQPRTNRASLLRAKLGTPDPATRKVFAF
ncbi:hypothetical protein FRB95_010531 [Tulasnella sp. JGI-2019a]|nr:hypothetical protein FRB95_010531 [Tulasnella sp. JGI-2019a]